MAGRRGEREGLDEDHAAAATWTCRLVVIGSIGIGRFALRLWRSEQFADARDVVGAGGVGQQAVVADAGEALREDVNEGSGGGIVCGAWSILFSISASASVGLSLSRGGLFFGLSATALWLWE